MLNKDIDSFSKDPEKFIRDKIEQFVLSNPENRLTHIDGDAIFEKPLVAYADGDNPLFSKFKEIIGDFHLTPREIYQKLANGRKAYDLSVICWVLPISKNTKASNRKQNKYPSMRWAHTRYYGEELNKSLRKYVVSLVGNMGYEGIAPFISEFFKVNKKTPVGIASTWSERHIQYVAGLGTFGLCDGFITAAGKAMRCGSVVTNLKLRPNKIKYRSHTANCLYLSHGSCGECITRCPVGAITKNGHDKEKCRGYTYGKVLSVCKDKFQVEVVGCGLCQTGVPCESAIPEE